MVGKPSYIQLRSIVVMAVLRCSISEFSSFRFRSSAHIKLTLECFRLVPPSPGTINDLALGVSLALGDFLARSRLGYIVFNLTIRVLRVAEAFWPDSFNNFRSNQAN